MESNIDLGFPENREPGWLTNRYFPSKVGGFPAWLELLLLPPPTMLQCETCKNQMAFLCQIYAPYDQEHNFHRMIYIFLCRNKDCQVQNSARNFLVLRSQMPKDNNFFSSEPPDDEGSPLPPVPSARSLCLACGCLALMLCSRCHSASYCSAPHQHADWGNHKKICGRTGIIPRPEPLLEITFPEFEIVIEEATMPEDEESDEEAEDDPAQIATFEKLSLEGAVGTMSKTSTAELEKYAGDEKKEDTYYSRFNQVIKPENSQILRYSRNGKPLWIADPKTTVADQLNIPVCPNCLAERKFEFQLMPQLLLLIDDEHLDWGVLAIYTCSVSCKPTGTNGYLKEYIVRQDVQP